MTGYPGISECIPLKTLTTLASLLGLVALLALPVPAQSAAATDRNARTSTAGECLLPGQVRRLGLDRYYLTPRRAVMLPAADCRLHGGTFTRLDFERDHYTPTSRR